MRTRLALSTVPMAIAITASALALPAAAAASPRLNKNVTCTKGSLANLQVQREDTGRLSLDFGVDMTRHVAGVAWRVRVTDNRSVIVSSTVRTGRDGSFSITRTLPAATSHIVAVATNRASGEVCRIVATV